jgi:hypothetical protein
MAEQCRVRFMGTRVRNTERSPVPVSSKPHEHVCLLDEGHDGPHESIYCSEVIVNDRHAERLAYFRSLAQEGGR